MRLGTVVIRAGLLAIGLVSAALAGDADGDGVADANDNCPYATNASQRDTGGLGASSPPDGTGDACQCGDVTGDGRVTSSDEAAIAQAVRQAPAAKLAKPELCDVGDSLGCSAADSAIVAQALLAPRSATIRPQCHEPRTIVVQGDTQTLSRTAPFAALWNETQRLICAQKLPRRIDFVLGTGDIVEQFDMASPQEVARADAAYDILDACRLRQALPGGNHDTNCTYSGCPPTYSWDAYLRFLKTRPSHAPALASPSGLSFAGPLFFDFWYLVLPFAAGVDEESWASSVLAGAPQGRSFWVIEHDAVTVPGPLNPSRAASRLAGMHPKQVFGVIGGHFIPDTASPRWTFSVLPSGQLALFSNYQEFDPLTNPREPFTEATLLEYLPLAQRWCAHDLDFIGRAQERFRPRACF